MTTNTEAEDQAFGDWLHKNAKETLNGWLFNYEDIFTFPVKTREDMYDIFIEIKYQKYERDTKSDN